MFDYQTMQKIADGKLHCICGNNDWKEFLYVGSDSEHVIAGCKRCAATHHHKDGKWQMLQSSPGKEES